MFYCHFIFQASHLVAILFFLFYFLFFIVKLNLQTSCNYVYMHFHIAPFLDLKQIFYSEFFIKIIAKYIVEFLRFIDLYS